MADNLEESLNLVINTRFKALNFNEITDDIADAANKLQRDFNKASRAFEEQLKNSANSYDKILKNVFVSGPTLAISAAKSAFSFLIDQTKYADQWGDAQYRAIGSVFDTADRAVSFSLKSKSSYDESSKALRSLVDTGFTLTEHVDRFGKFDDAIDNTTSKALKFGYATGSNIEGIIKFTRLLDVAGGGLTVARDQYDMLTIASAKLALSSEDNNNIMSSLVHNAMALNLAYGPDTVYEYTRSLAVLSGAAKMAAVDTGEAQDIMQGLASDPMRFIRALGSDALFNAPEKNLEILAGKAEEIKDQMQSWPPGLANKMLFDVYGIGAAQLEVLRKYNKARSSLDKATLLDINNVNEAWNARIGTITEQLSKASMVFDASIKKMLKPILSVISGDDRDGSNSAIMKAVDGFSAFTDQFGERMSNKLNEMKKKFKIDETSIEGYKDIGKNWANQFADYFVENKIFEGFLNEIRSIFTFDVENSYILSGIKVAYEFVKSGVDRLVESIDRLSSTLQNSWFFSDQSMYGKTKEVANKSYFGKAWNYATEPKDTNINELVYNNILEASRRKFNEYTNLQNVKIYAEKSKNDVIYQLEKSIEAGKINLKMLNEAERMLDDLENNKEYFKNLTDKQLAGVNYTGVLIERAKSINRSELNKTKSLSLEEQANSMPNSGISFNSNNMDQRAIRELLESLKNIETHTKLTGEKTTELNEKQKTNVPGKTGTASGSLGRVQAMTSAN